MEKKYIGENGISIKLITEKIKREVINRNEKGQKIKKKNYPQSGKLIVSDRKILTIGIHLLYRIVTEGINKQQKELLLGKEDVSKVRKEILGYSDIIKEFMRRIYVGAEFEYNLQQSIDITLEQSKISQAVRDGVILKQEKRTEIVEGKEKEIVYDTSMSINEITELFRRYEMNEYSIATMKMLNYVSIGFVVASIIGSVASKNPSEKNKLNNLISLSTFATDGLKIIKGIGIEQSKEKKEKKELSFLAFRMMDDLVKKETVSNRAKNTEIENLKTVVKKQINVENKIKNKTLQLNILIDLIVCMLSGVFVNSKLKFKENGKIDGQSLAVALLELDNTAENSRKLIGNIRNLAANSDDEKKFKEVCKQITEVIKQMEEKVYPLEGANHPFNSIEITDFCRKILS